MHFTKLKEKRAKIEVTTQKGYTAIMEQVLNKKQKKPLLPENLDDAFSEDDTTISPNLTQNMILKLKC